MMVPLFFFFRRNWRVSASELETVTWDVTLLPMSQMNCVKLQNAAVVTCGLEIIFESMCRLLSISCEAATIMLFCFGHCCFAAGHTLARALIENKQ